jgi:CheY-like chemotaxis protein
MNTPDESVFGEVNNAGGDGTQQDALPLETARGTLSGQVVILIVEDSTTQALLLRHLLEEHQCEVLIAQNGQEALALIRKQRPTLVITDINMPEMDGYQLCKTIKSDEALCDLPVILLTSLSDPKDVLTGIECEVSRMTGKSHSASSLLIVLQSW